MSNDIPGVNVVLTADSKKLLAEFKRAIDAGKKLDEAMGDLQKGLSKLNGDRLTRLADKLAGTKATKEMGDLALAVEKLRKEGRLTEPVLENIVKRMDRLRSQGATVAPALAGINSELAKLRKGGGIGDIVGREAAANAAALTNRLGPLGGVLTSIGPAGLGAAAGLGALTAVGGGMLTLAGNAVAAGGRLADLNAKTDLSVEAIQRLTHSGSLVGVEFGTISGALTKLRQAMIKTPEDFAALGIEIKTLREMQPEQQLAEMARAVASIADPALRDAAAVHYLGKAATEVLPFMRSEFVSASYEADRLGVVMSTETVTALDATGDAATKLNNAWEGLKLNLGASIATAGDAAGTLETVAQAVGLVSRALATADFSKLLTLMKFAAPLPMAAAGAVTSYAGGALDELRKAELAVIESNASHIAANGKGPMAAAALKTLAEQARSLRKEGEPLPGILEGMVQALDRVAKVDTGALETIIGGDKPKAAKVDAGIAGQVADWEKSAATINRVHADVMASGDKWAEAEQKIHDEAARSIEDLERRYVAAKGAIAEADLKAMKGTVEATEAQKILDLEFQKAIADETKAADKRDAANADTVKGLQKWTAAQRAVSKEAREFNDIVAKSHGFSSFLEATPEVQAGILDGTITIKEETEQWSVALSRVADIFQVLGVKGGSVLGVLMGGIAGGASALDGLSKAKGTLGKVSGAMGVAGVGLSVAMGVANAFTASAEEKVMSSIGERWGISISEALAKSIAETAERLHISKDLAAMLHADDIFAATGGTTPIFDLLNAVKLGAVPAAEGVETLGSAFEALKKAAEGGSSASTVAMVQMIRRSRELGIAIPEMQQAIEGLLTDAVEQLQIILQSQKGPQSAGQIKANQTITGSIFAAQSATMGVPEAAELMRASIEEILKSLPDGATLTGPMADAAQMLDLLNNEGFKAAAEGATAAGKALKDLALSANLTQETADAFGVTAQSFFDQAKAGALERGLSEDEARKAAERANLPLLKELQTSRELGIVLSPESEKLLADAQRDGILPMRTIAEQSLSVLKQIRDGKTGDSPTPTTTTGGNPLPTGPPTGPPSDHPGRDHHFSGFGRLDPDLLARANFAIPSAGGSSDLMRSATRVVSRDGASGGRGGSPVNVLAKVNVTLPGVKNARQFTDELADILDRRLADKLEGALDRQARRRR